MKMKPLDSASATLPASRPSTTRNTKGFTFRAPPSSFSYIAARPPKNLLSFCSFVFTSSLEDMAGTTVRAISRLASRE